jgi:hypothetical protein
MKRLGLLAMAALAASCGPATNILPVNDFDRPTDVAFMCFGAFPEGTTADGGVPAGGAGQLKVSGRPMRACHPQNEYDPGALTTTRTFAFMPNSAGGTLSAVDVDHWKLADLNLDTSGYGTLPLGQDPEQISASDDGCRLISANRDSCDLTLVDPSILVAPTFNANFGNIDLSDPLRAAAQNFRPIKGDGTPLVAAPYEAVFVPQDTSSLVTETSASLPITTTQTPVCGSGAAAYPQGWPAQPYWYALVTYPSCDLIAMIELPSGQIVSSAHVVRQGPPDSPTVALVDAGTSPICPSTSCAGQALPPSAAITSDGAVRSDASGTVDASVPPLAEAGAPDATAPGTGGGAAGAGGGGTGGGAPGGGATGGSPDAGGADAGATGGSQGLGNQYQDVPYVGPGPIGPSGIAIVPGGSRAYISLANASYVISVGLTSSGLTLPSNSVYLHEGARGSTRVRLNVDPNRYLTSPGIAGVFVGAQTATTTQGTTPDSKREYLYVIARDGTLRVIQVVNAGSETECETNADPLLLPAPFSATSPCIDVNAAYRRPFSIGPGIQFPSLPIDVAAADIENAPPDTGEQSVNGAHAWVITDSGIVYLVNINPVLRSYYLSLSTSPPPAMPFDFVLTNPAETAPFVNTLRDRNVISFSVTLDPSSGPPRVDVLPNVPATGPYIEQFYTQGSILNATATSSAYMQTVAFFPQDPHPTNPDDPIDRRAITAQTWSVTWQGALSGVRNTGAPLPSGFGLTSFPGGGVSGSLPTDSLFQDGGANYCALGVITGDLVTLTGCTDNTQCGLGETCVQGDSVSSAAAGLTVTGICVDPNRQTAQTSLCSEFLNSVRRYEVEAASLTSLVIRPHLDEVILSTLTSPCHPDIPATATTKEIPDDCPDIVDDLSTANFQCLTKYPGGNIGPRCLMTCELNSDCRAGRLCVNFDTATTVPSSCNKKPSDGGPPDPDADCACKGPNCFCADAPPFDGTGKACFDQLVNYQVNSGRTFLVAGSSSGLVTTAALPSSNGTCSDNPTPDPRFSFRIPMNAPECSNASSSLARIDSRLDPDSYAGDGTAQAQVVSDTNTLVKFVTSTPAPADPCLYMGGRSAGDPVIGPQPPDGGVDADGGVGAPPTTHVRALFQNSQLSFVLANVDRAPTSQFFTSFDVHGGFAPQVVQDPVTIEVSMPARIVLGPVDSLAQVTSGTAKPMYEVPYFLVVDQHRLGREQGGGPTRGQLLRINPLGDAVTIGVAATGYQPIFEDYNASGGLFPIQ